MKGNGFYSGESTLWTTNRSRRRDLLELAGLYLLILVVLWTPQPWQAVLWCVGAATVAFVAYRSFEGFTPMGLCRANLTRSLWAVGLAAVIAFVSVMVAARLHTLHVPGTAWLFVRHYGAYVLWAAIQQIVLQWFFLSRSLRLLPDATSAAAITAGLFAVAHLPNPILTVITLFFGMASCLFFIHYRNLVPLALAHAILGTCIGVTIPSPIDHNMLVGISYLTYVDRPALSKAAWLPKP
jgi:membrane protease YdiL (CAAX protease family)